MEILQDLAFYVGLPFLFLFLTNAAKKRRSFTPLVNSRSGADYYKQENAERKLNQAVRKAVYNRDRGICQLCDSLTYYSENIRFPHAVRFLNWALGREIRKYHYGHVIPNAYGGEETIENGVCQCETCNIKLKQRFTARAAELLKKRKQTVYIEKSRIAYVWRPDIRSIEDV